VFDSLIGSRILVTNLEVRAPLLWLLRVDSGYGVVPIELAAFFDAGVAWTADTRPTFAGGTRRVVRSAGAAVRFNALGLFVVEVAASRPLDRVVRAWRWQVGIRQVF
jgi:outer membrane protein assembly factor BamA